jgi:hypothetical protein
MIEESTIGKDNTVTVFFASQLSIVNRQFKGGIGG